MSAVDWGKVLFCLTPAQLRCLASMMEDAAKWGHISNDGIVALASGRAFIRSMFGSEEAWRKFDDAARKAPKRGKVDGNMYWCPACRSYHVDPVNYEHKALLICKAP